MRSIANFGREGTLRILSELGSPVLGKPFMRQLDSGKYILVRGRARKLIRKDLLQSHLDLIADGLNKGVSRLRYRQQESLMERLARKQQDARYRGIRTEGGGREILNADLNIRQHFRAKAYDALTEKSSAYKNYKAVSAEHGTYQEGLARDLKVKYMSLRKRYRDAREKRSQFMKGLNLLAEFRKRGARDRKKRKSRLIKAGMIAGGVAGTGLLAGGGYLLLKGRLKRAPQYMPQPGLVRVGPSRSAPPDNLGKPPGRTGKEWKGYQKQNPGSYRLRNRRRYDPGLYSRAEASLAEFARRGRKKRARCRRRK